MSAASPKLARLMQHLTSRPADSPNLPARAKSMWPENAEEWIARDLGIDVSVIFEGVFPGSEDVSMIDVERQIFQLYAKENPFPDSGNCRDFLRTRAHPDLIERFRWEIMRPDAWAIYTSVAARIYENFFDEPYVREIGVLLKEMGGEALMEMVYYIFVLCAPSCALTKGLFSMLSYWWNGIGDWCP